MRLFLFPLLAAGLLAFVPSSQPRPRREFRPVAGSGRVAAFSADGNLLAVGGGAAPVAVFQTRTGLLLRTYLAHAQPVTDLAFAPHPDSVLSVDAAGRAGLWSAETLTTLRTWQAPAPLLAVAFAPAGGQAVLVSARACWLWQLRGAANTAPTLLKLTMPLKSAVTTVAFGADGQLALGFDSGVALVYDLRTHSQVQKALGTTTVRSLYLHADTLLAATGTPDLKTWSLRSEAPVTSQRLPQVLTAVAAGPSAHTLALGFATGEAMVWNRAQNRSEYVCAGPGAACRVQVQPAGDLLLTTHDGGTPKTWQVPENSAAE